jgi:hypothetical protein
MRLHEKNCIGLSPGEIASVSSGEFVRFVRFKADVCGLVMADWTMSGIQFWFTGNIREENAFRLEDAFRWLKAVDYLMSWQKDLSRIACVVLAASNLGVTQWRILNKWGYCSFQNELRDENEAFMETGRKLMDTMRPEAARRLEADLAGKAFVSDLEWRRRLGRNWRYDVA